MFPGAVRRWVGAALAGATAVVVLATSASDGRPVTGLVLAAPLLALAWWQAPKASPSSVSHQHAEHLRSSDSAVVIYWRPGCPYCTRLRARLGRARRDAVWVDIWSDEAAAQFVRGANDGNETVPTVAVDDQLWTNPEPARVRAALRARAESQVGPPDH